MTQPLDRPVWSALTSGWRHLAEGDGPALRQDHAYGPFAAARNGSAQAAAALAALVPPGGSLWLIESDPVPPPPGCAILRVAPTAQMVLDRPAPAAAPPPEPIPLGEGDAAEMRELAALTRPGPFHRHTHRLSQFLGVRIDCRLAAMAGERMRLDGFAEVSGVCTHPDYRGRGLAGGLMRLVAARIADRGETPILHTYADNVGAVALYETLGYRLRRVLALLEIARG